MKVDEEISKNLFQILSIFLICKSFYKWNSLPTKDLCNKYL